MSAKITTGFDGLSGMLLTVRKGRLQKELVEQLHESGEKVVVDIRNAASTRIERRAATTVEAVKSSKGVTISGGRGGGLPTELFPGGEFGGRSRKKKMRKVPVFGSRPVWIEKRTTMMFKPHLGTHGHFFWPEIRDWLPKVREETTEVVEKILSRRSL